MNVTTSTAKIDSRLTYHVNIFGSLSKINLSTIVYLIKLAYVSYSESFNENYNFQYVSLSCDSMCITRISCILMTLFVLLFYIPIYVFVYFMFLKLTFNFPPLTQMCLSHFQSNCRRYVVLASGVAGGAKLSELARHFRTPIRHYQKVSHPHLTPD